MLASEIISPNWDAPWLQHLHLSPELTQKTLSLHQLASQLNVALARRAPIITGFGKALKFVAQSELPSTTTYETFIGNTGKVPTRDNAHDFFNAAIWLTFPRTKAVLNARQHTEIERSGICAKRTKLRDALTLFDENGAVLVTAQPSIARALKQFDWHGTLIEPRALWSNPKAPSANAQAGVYIFGHALLEQLEKPRKGLCAHTWVLEVEPNWFTQDANTQLASVDSMLANALELTELHTRAFCPLPVLGIPHFWQANESPSFYDDANVFRSGRRKKPSS